MYDRTAKEKETSFQFIDYTHCVSDFTLNKFEMSKLRFLSIHSSKCLTLLFTAIGRPSHKIFGFRVAVLAP